MHTCYPPRGLVDTVHGVMGCRFDTELFHYAPEPRSYSLNSVALRLNVNDFWRRGMRFWCTQTRLYSTVFWGEIGFLDLWLPLVINMDVRDYKSSETIPNKFNTNSNDTRTSSMAKSTIFATLLQSKYFIKLQHWRRFTVWMFYLTKLTHILTT